MGTEFVTPVGRIVWGHPSRAQQKRNMDTGKLVVKDDGTPAMQFAMGVAFDKALFQQTIWPEMLKEAMVGYPIGQFPEKFSWKYKDGDNPGVDNTGKPIPLKPEQAGCFVLTIVSELPVAPGVFKYENGQYRQLTDKEIKCGDYVSVGLQLQVNVPQNRTHTPSLYVNPRAVELVGYGIEIVGGGQADPNAMFGGRQHQLPPGASTMPISAAPQAQMPGMGGGMPQGQQMQPNPGQMMPGQMPMAPHGQPMMQPQYQAPQGQPMQYAPQPGQMPMGPQGQPQTFAPAHDFVANAGHQMPGQMPQGGQPQYYAPQGQPVPNPGQTPMAPQGQPMQYAAQPGQQYAPQPGPGMMPPR